MSYSIDVKEHRKTGLLVAVCREIPGFIVHARSDEELEQKLPKEFEVYMDAIGQPIGAVVLEDVTAPGFWPKAYAANTVLEAA